VDPNEEVRHSTSDLGRRIARHYASEAEAYRDLWAPVLVRLAEWLIDQLPLQDARQVLDLGCGVGTLLPHLREAAPEAQIVGLDRTEGMVSLGSRDFPLLVGDAVGLPFRDASFDVVTMVFMLFHLPQPIAALNEVRRILRPGGRLGLLTWGKERDSRALTEWVRALDAAHAAEFRGRLSWHELVDSPRKTTELLQDAGFTDVTVMAMSFVEHPTCEEFLAQRTNLGFCRYRWESLDEADRQDVLHIARRRLEEMSSDDFEEDAEVIVTVGRRPR
jgi:ubiquinone/menaquinone biosynthesis C-methylase UbiE